MPFLFIYKAKAVSKHSSLFEEKISRLFSELWFFLLAVSVQFYGITQWSKDKISLYLI
jgi:hypothetical protein